MKRVNTFASKSRAALVRGFGLVEVIITIAIVAILGAVGAPYVNELIIEGRAEPTYNDVVKITSKIRSNMMGQGNTPYTAMSTAMFANTANKLATVLEVDGTGATATIQHRIGATSSQITVAPATATVLGDSYAVTFPTVNRAACAPLATGLSRAALRITVNGTVVKALGGTYSGGNAINACTDDDTNTLVFTFN